MVKMANLMFYGLGCFFVFVFVFNITVKQRQRRLGEGEESRRREQGSVADSPVTESKWRQ